MAVILGLLLAIPAIVFVAIPFYRYKKPNIEVQGFSQEIGNIRSERESIYKQLETLQLEHDLGLISSTEYQERELSLRIEAAKNFQVQSEFLKTNSTSFEEQDINALALNESESTGMVTPNHPTNGDESKDDNSECSTG
ncbi:hypothetical protein FIM02_01930 [SAR202 cluster bacterium AD-802-E10_MRT_200m]|nr:hypothetical protein [SAR202 cluster bacterium AD-802-E10_MRT_200m]